MSQDDLVKESREVSDFDRVKLQDYGELVITQGDQETLTVEAHPDVLPAIRTEVKNGKLTLRIDRTWFERLSDTLRSGLSRHRILYTLILNDLHELSILGAGKVKAYEIESDHLKITLSGAADLRIPSLNVEILTVEMPGAGQVALSGHTTEQEVKITGAGNYEASKLESRDARVVLSGAGKAAVWVNGTLDVRLSGIGAVEYYGNPTLNQAVTGLGKVTGLGNP